MQADAKYAEAHTHLDTEKYMEKYTLISRHRQADPTTYALNKASHSIVDHWTRNLAIATLLAIKHR